MPDNILYIPELNPVIFYDRARANIPKYHTKHLDSWMFEERRYPWQQKRAFKQIWQTTDIISLQFICNFDPIKVRILDSKGNMVEEFIALNQLPNIYLPGYFCYEVEMSLAGMETGCYTFELTAGIGLQSVVLDSDTHYISAEPIKDSIILEYNNSYYHKDVLFETGVKFQYRTYGAFGPLLPYAREEKYRNGRFNNKILSSRSVKQWPLYLGGRYGNPDEHINLVHEIWTCDIIMVDGKLFNIAEESKFETPEVEDYPRRGIKILVEEGINRTSRLFTLPSLGGRRLITSIMTSSRVFGDTFNQSSGNTIPTHNIENE